MTEATIRMEVNIGTDESPIWAPEPATKPNTVEGRDWWEMLAEGSIIVGNELLAALLKFLGKRE